MAVVESTMVPLGFAVPDFELEDVLSGKMVNRSKFAGKPLLVVFMSNHCPYARHVEERFGELAAGFIERGGAVAAICSNDATAYPDDAPAELAAQARRAGFGFPYLHDPSQEVAKAYKAMCTPDFFLFDREHRLFYRGRFDASRPGQDTPVTGEDLQAAIDLLLAGGAPPEPQWPSMGCNIKWKPGNEPDYFG